MTSTQELGISDAARAVGMSADAVRYYDRCGLLKDVGRDAVGNRRFTAGDVGWLRVLRCLRDTGMTMEDLRRFCALDGVAEPAARRRLLVRERARHRHLGYRWTVCRWGSAAGRGAVDDEESVRALRCAVELGATFIDTADAYGTEHAERVIGRALGENPSRHR